jgi:type I restriction enzyme R subunit
MSSPKPQNFPMSIPLTEILDKYIEYGSAQFQIPEILKIPPISNRGTVMDIAKMFNGAEKLRAAVNEMQTLLYAP